MAERREVLVEAGKQRSLGEMRRQAVLLHRDGGEVSIAHREPRQTPGGGCPSRAG